LLLSHFPPGQMHACMHSTSADTLHTHGQACTLECSFCHLESPARDLTL
jgi:hypothetical protein